MRRRARRVLVVTAVGAVASASLFAGGSIAAAALLARRWTRRVEVEGRSMSPAFEPGDRVLFVRLPLRWPVWPGDVVALPDPRRPARMLVKRVVAVTPEGLTVLGDNLSESTDSRDFGAVRREAVWGLALYRYAPAGRTGRLIRGRPRDCKWSGGYYRDRSLRAMGWRRPTDM